MIYKCTCGVLWTSRSTTQRVDPTKATQRLCSDCVDFDWPLYTKRVEYAKSLKLSK